MNFKANTNLATESSSPNLKFQISILASAISDDGTIAGLYRFLYVRKTVGSKTTGPFSMEKIKQPQAPFITFSWGDSGSFETLAEGTIYYSFVLVNDDGTEEENLPVVFVVSYDM